MGRQVGLLTNSPLMQSDFRDGARPEEKEDHTHVTVNAFRKRVLRVSHGKLKCKRKKIDLAIFWRRPSYWHRIYESRKDA
jgi:hypothetical protein